MNIIELKNVQKSFQGKVVLQNLALTVGQGDIFGFLGPNGSGKTTTLRILLGLLRQDSGMVKVMGRDMVGHDKYICQKVNMLPESHGLYSWMKADEYLVFFGRLYGKQLNKTKCARLLEVVGLDHAENRSIRQFSRGMKQRLGIARTLINDPELILLDEPTNGLDPKGRKDIHNLLKKLNTERSITIVLSTHILDDVEHLCNRIGILNEHRLQYQGSLAAERDTLSPLYRFYIRNSEQENTIADITGIDVLSQNNGWFHCRLKDKKVEQVVAEMANRGFPPSQVIKEGGDLEKMYLHYTGGDQ